MEIKKFDILSFDQVHRSLPNKAQKHPQKSSFDLPNQIHSIDCHAPRKEGKFTKIRNLSLRSKTIFRTGSRLFVQIKFLLLAFPSAKSRFI
jgi:hypothetical protein